MYIENSEDEPNTIIELNMRVLGTQLGSSDDNYRIIETIFSNFNLFPQANKSNQAKENSSHLLGIPISYQIANRTMIKANEDLVRFQIRVSAVRKSIRKNKQTKKFYMIFIGNAIIEYLMCSLVI